jgi:hypothetical protein
MDCMLICTKINGVYGSRLVIIKVAECYDKILKKIRYTRCSITNFIVQWYPEEI